MGSDFKHFFATGDAGQNYALEAGDILYVPDSPLSHFNFVMSELVGPVTGVTAAGTSARTASGH